MRLWNRICHVLNRLCAVLRHLEDILKRLTCVLEQAESMILLHVLWKSSFEPICFNNIYWKRFVCVWNRIWAVLNRLWTVLSHLETVFKRLRCVLELAYMLWKQLSQASCVPLKPHLPRLELSLSRLETSKTQGFGCIHLSKVKLSLDGYYLFNSFNVVLICGISLWLQQMNWHNLLVASIVFFQFETQA